MHRKLFGRLVVAILLLIIALSANAGSATSLVIQSCSPLFAPCAAPTFVPGQPFTVWVFAVDASNQLASNYTGTVSITALGAESVLPVPHTYTSTDNSAFPFTVTITTPASTGDSPVTPIRATDTNGLSSTVGFLPLLLPQAVTSAPSLSFISGLLLCLLLAVAATLVPRVKGRNPNYSFSGRLRRR